MIKPTIILFAIFLIFSISVFAQENLPPVGSSKSLTLDTGMGNIIGTLLVPAQSEEIPVALIIAGSGPTDRNGNNPQITNNSLKMLAEELNENGIASLRYDKRGIGESKSASVAERNLRFEDYIYDANKWIELLKKDKRFSKVIVIGHSEGSLIGMIASRLAGSDGFVSAAGVGNSADIVLKKQLSNQPEEVSAVANPIIDSLVAGKMVRNIHPMYKALFRESVQPYLISWFKYKPTDEMAKLKIPSLVIQGTTDIQVDVDEAKLLAKANKNAKLVIVDGMNHILKKAPAERQANYATYTNPNLPIDKKFTNSIVEFISSVK